MTLRLVPRPRLALVPPPPDDGADRGSARCGNCGSARVVSCVGRSIEPRSLRVVWTQCLDCGAVSDPAPVA